MKRIVSAALCLLLLVVLSTALAGSAGTSSNPLISLSYINDTFAANISKNSKTTISSALKNEYNEAYSKLESSYNRYLQLAGGNTSGGNTPSGGSEKLSLQAGSSVTMSTGSGITVISGSVTLSIQSGTVIDVSSGKELSNGAVIQKDTRCLCAENTSASFTAPSGAVLVVDGKYTLSTSAPVPGTPNQSVFTDVAQDHWFYDAVSFVYDEGLMNGVSSTEFGVSASTTRAMFVTILYRMVGSPAASGTSQFSDVTDPSLYYYDAVIWSAANNIVNGYGDGTFRPGDNITREQMMAIMYRFAAYRGKNTAIINTSLFDSFPDKASVSEYAVDAAKWATSNLLINGMDGRLNPGGTAIRAQVAQIIWKFCEYME